MSRTALRTTFAAFLVATLAAGPALAALPPGLVDPPPPATAPQPPQQPAEPDRQPAAPQPPPGGEMVFDPDFQVQNRARVAIIALHVTASRLDRRGPNLLGRGRIDPTQSFSVRPARNGDCEYDVRVVYEGGRSEDRMAQNVCAINEMAFTGPQTAGEAAPGTPAGQPGRVRVVDTLRQAEPEEAPQPRRRRTAAAPTAPAPQQQPAPTTQPAPATQPRRTGNQRPDIWVVNTSSTEITGIQSSPVSDPNWGVNRLTGNVAAGQRHALLLPGNLGCEWDIRVTYSGGQTEERRNVNFCEIEQLEFAGAQRRTER